MKGNSLMEWLVKLVFALMLLPFVISLVLQAIAALFQAIVAFLFALVPWLIGLAFLLPAVAGIGAAVVMRRRLPRQTENRYPPAGAQAVRRPRGPGRTDDE